MLSIELKILICFVWAFIVFFITALIIGAEGKAKWFQPVSYTHLDVYKRQEYRVAAKEAVLSKLKAPSTAKFDIKQVIRYKNSVTVRGTVNAQNEFGAMIKGTFFVKILADTGTVDSVSVNNL